MRSFAALFAALDASTATEAKVLAMAHYLDQAEPDDAAWAVYMLAGGKPPQAVPTAVLRATATRLAGLPDWLFDAAYQAAGDLAETIAQVLPPPGRQSDLGLADWLLQRLATLRGLDPDAQSERLTQWFDELAPPERFLLVKLIGGGFRVGVSKLLVQRALARHAGLDAKLVAQRMMGYTDARTPPTAARLQALLAPADAAAPADGQPYPFFLAHALEPALDTLAQRLGPAADWLAEWKYDGIRAQLVCRHGQVWLWSRGEELVTERFPEVAALAAGLPAGTVLDGELLVWPDGAEAPAPFNLLQQRLGRKTVGRKLLTELPVVFLAYDVMEAAGADVRAEPQWQRRQRLAQLLAGGPFRVSPLVLGDDWPALAALQQGSRARGVEGLMLKHRQAQYGSGRTKADGVWWKWKVAPMTVDAVLVYAQAGHGRRSGVYTDYTFAVWNRAPADPAEAQAVLQAIAERRPADPQGLQLVAFAKAYSGLTDDEFKQVDRVIRATTLEKFGPVRSVLPSLVFELGFEGINASKRHKCGLAVRFPRMLRLRPDKPLHEADTLPMLEARVNPR